MGDDGAVLLPDRRRRAAAVAVGRGAGTAGRGDGGTQGRGQWLVPSENVILLNTLYLPEGLRMGRRFTSSSVAAS